MFVAAEVREVEGREVNTIFSLATAIEADWLRELFPEDLKSDLHVEFDAQARRVQAAELVRFRGLALSAKRVDPPPADAAARILADEILAGRLPLPNWDHGVEQWLLRLRLLCRHCPELQLPAITEDDRKHIIEQLCHGAVSYKDIKERESETAGDVMAVRCATAVAGQARAGTVDAAERPHAQGDLRSDRLAAHRPPHPGTLRCDPDAEDCDGTGAGGGAHPDAGNEIRSRSRKTWRISGANIIRASNPSCNGNIRNTCGDE